VRRGPNRSPAKPAEKNNKGSSMAHLTDRFAEAVRTLVGDGPIKQRLSRAYSEQLATLDNAELPAALRNEFSGLHAALNRVAPFGKESRVRATVQKMSAGEASGHAETIVRLFMGLLSHTERAEPLKVVGAQKAPRYVTQRS
jgi:hypothetical protein